MAWTTEMNEEVMRCYYRASQLGNLRIGYREQMRRFFLTKFPELAELSTQRLADQRRAICTNNLINEIRRDELRAEAELILQGSELRAETATVSEVNPDESLQITSGSGVTLQEVLPVESVLSSLRIKIEHEFDRALLEFAGMNPECRPRLPRLPFSKKLAQITSEMNSVLQEKTWDEMDFLQMVDTIYAAAVAITRYMGFKLLHIARPHQRQANWVPAWKRRLDRQIEEIRVNIGRFHQWAQGNHSRRLRNKINAVKTKLRSHSTWGEENDSVDSYLDTLKQRLAVLVQRRARYMKSFRRASDNKMFARNERSFYRKLSGETNDSTGPVPNIDDLGEFWASIWGNQSTHDADASWIGEFERNATVTSTMSEIVITADDIRERLRGVKNWAAPGRDGIYCFYLKKFTAVHSGMAKAFNSFLLNPASMPNYFTQGTTMLIHKGGDSSQPSTYRPITCLPVTYKLLTAVIAKHIEAHCTRNSVIAEQQKGCERFAMGCKEQLIIDAVITGQATHSCRNLYAAYIDFAKAFDSVPHSWLLYVLKVYGIADQVVEWLRTVMQMWCTSLQPLSGTSSPTINIRRGIFQGDSLSPLLFCLALNPLSNMLDRTGYGFTLKYQGSNLMQLSHLFYMDDLKLYAASPSHLQQMLNVVSLFGKTLRMDFGLRKCRTQALVGGQHAAVGFSLGANDILPLEMGESYKYLGLLQTRGTDQRIVRNLCEAEFTRRIRSLLKTGLNSGNLARAINSYAIPVLAYTFGVIKWSATQLEALERKVRVLFTRSCCHHPRAAIERFLLPRVQGGRGLGHITSRHDECVMQLQTYFNEKASCSRIIEAICQIDANSTPLRLARSRPESLGVTPTDLLDNWRRKALHGRYLADVEKPEVDRDATFAWLKIGYLFPETEGFLVAIQDQVIATKNYLKCIVGASQLDDHCRMCRAVPETIQHLVAGCSVLAPREYLRRHNNVAKIVHQELAFHYGLSETSKCPYYKYEPTSVLENDRARLYWDRSVLTDRPVPHNRPDMVLIDKTSKIGYLVDVAVPACRNLNRTCSEKVQKYEELRQEMKQLLQLKYVEVVPLVISAVGTVPVSLKPGLYKLGLEERIVVGLQKAAILETCSLIRKVMGENSY